MASFVFRMKSVTVCLVMRGGEEIFLCFVSDYKGGGEVIPCRFGQFQN